MRSNLRKSQFAIPDILLAAATLTALGTIARDKRKDDIKEDIYRGKMTREGIVVYTVRERLAEIYYHKCAYCEGIEFEPDVEHYRPKKKVTRENTHDGYYWLCYEWSNLLPACPLCNREAGKKNQFPVLGNRVMAPLFDANNLLDQVKCGASVSPLIDERPFLLHPEIDEPKPFFKFHKNGKMEGIDAEGRGSATIKICNLNRKNLLRLRQLLTIDETLHAIQRILLQFTRSILTASQTKILLFDIFDEMVRKQQPEKPYSLMAEYVFENFKTIILPLLDEPIQENLSMAYDAYLQENIN